MVTCRPIGVVARGCGHGIVVGITVVAGALALSACNAKTTTPGKKSALDTIKKSQEKSKGKGKNKSGQNNNEGKMGPSR